jgi:hypothetical protein
MTEKMSSRKLFKRLQPKFNEITWHADEFTNESLLLIPGFGENPISRQACTPEGQFYSVWWSDYNGNLGREDRRPSFNIREGNLVFGFSFDPTSKEKMEHQLEKAVIQKLYDGPFKGRHFFMRPDNFEHTPFHAGIPSIIPVKFSIDGDMIQGLRLGEIMAHDWKFFIPEGPERVAIQTLIDLEYAQDEQEKYHRLDPAKKKVRELRTQLDESLATIAM